MKEMEASSFGRQSYYVLVLQGILCQESKCYGPFDEEKARGFAASHAKAGHKSVVVREIAVATPSVAWEDKR